MARTLLVGAGVLDPGAWPSPGDRTVPLTTDAIEVDLLVRNSDSSFDDLINNLEGNEQVRYARMINIEETTLIT